MRCLMTTIAAALAVSAAFPAYAQTFTGKDLSVIRDTARNNEMRFKRDYKGQQFKATMAFKSASESLFSSNKYLVSFTTDGGQTDCWVTDKAQINMIIDWNKGQKVVVEGTIDDTVMGDLKLNNCSIR